MPQKQYTIARYTFIEALRNRLFLLSITGLICLFGMAEFAGELAITETRQIQAALVAATTRWFLVTTCALFVITSMVRESNDKGLELILSLPVSRISYYIGKYCGFLLLAIVILVLSAPLLLIYADPAALAGWLFSMLCEIAIIIAVSMLCLFTFSNITIAFMSTLAFYILARSIGTIQLLSTSPILESESYSQQFMNQLVNLIAWVLPDLNAFTRSDWLLYGIEDNALVFVLMQTLVYLGILFAAGLFDLYRKEL
jgi:ABC-type transport system involved in multi-copper enzyme maturation permease subunit